MVGGAGEGKGVDVMRTSEEEIDTKGPWEGCLEPVEGKKSLWHLCLALISGKHRGGRRSYFIGLC